MRECRTGEQVSAGNQVTEGAGVTSGQVGVVGLVSGAQADKE